MKREEQSRDNVRVLWVGCRDKKDLLLAYAQKHGMGQLAIDAGDTIVDRFDIRSGAGIVLIRRDGVMKARLDGNFGERKLRSYLDAALAPDPKPGTKSKS